MEFKGTKNKWKRIDNFVYALNDKGTNAFSLSINNDGNTSKEEQEANALLISKAPEMLDMLQNVLEINKHHNFNGHLINEQNEQLIKQATEL